MKDKSLLFIVPPICRARWHASLARMMLVAVIAACHPLYAPRAELIR
jgi:hypothetical protein